MTWHDAHLPTTCPDIPSEYLIGLGRGKLGSWLQEIVDDGARVVISRGSVGIGTTACIIRPVSGERVCGYDGDGDVEFAIVRAYRAWEGRER